MQQHEPSDHPGQAGASPTVKEQDPLTARRDLLLVAAITLLSFALAAAFEFREWLAEITEPLEPYQIDELPFVFAVLAIAMSWFSWRRWRHARNELQLRMQAQAALAERERQYRTLFMEDLAGNAVSTRDGVIELCNPAMARILGLDGPEQALGRNMAEFYVDREQWRGHRRLAQQGERVEVPVLALEAEDGTPVKVIARLLPHGPMGQERGLHVYFVDVSALDSMQRQLADSLGENRLLSQKYMKVQEDERRSLAREMHDELGQCLNAIKLDAVSIRSMTQDTLPEAEARANAIIELSGHVYDVVRGIMQRLRPAALDALGLHDAVGQLVGQWQRRNGEVDVRFESSGELAGLGEAVNITVYRIVQECLTNVVKHAQASHVVVGLHRTGKAEVRVSVRDDGRGFDAQAKRTGLGLVGLRERVEALAGRLALTAQPGRGVEINATLPVSEEAQGADAEDRPVGSSKHIHGRVGA